MVLEFEGVSFTYPGSSEPALHDVDLTLAPGQVVGIVGPTDAGKSTFCLVAAGLAPKVAGGALQGRVLVDGEDLAHLSMYDVPGRVGILFQQPESQLSGLARTVFDEVVFGPANLGWPEPDVRQTAHEALHTLDIEHLARRDPSYLSGGEQQLVALASVLAMRPRYLVLDEPTAILDPSGTTLVCEAIRRLALEGRGLLVAEQRTDVLERVCSEALALDHGRIVLYGAAGNVLADPRLHELGVQPPASVRLRHLLRGEGLSEAMLRDA